MSEVYRFKAMSQVEVLEAPTGGTTLLAVEDGAVKQVPASAVGGSGSYMVRLTIDLTTGAMSADRTYEEIAAAVEDGCAPVLYISAGEGMFYLLPLVMMESGVLVFMMFMGETPMSVTCTQENVWAIGGE